MVHGLDPGHYFSSSYKKRGFRGSVVGCRDDAVAITSNIILIVRSFSHTMMVKSCCVSNNDSHSHTNLAETCPQGMLLTLVTNILDGRLVDINVPAILQSIL